MIAAHTPFNAISNSISEPSDPVALSGFNLWILSFRSEAPFKGIVQIDNAVDGFEDLYINHATPGIIDSNEGPRYLIVSSGVYRFRMTAGTAPVEMRARERSIMNYARVQAKVQQNGDE